MTIETNETNEFALDYRFAVNSPANAHRLHALRDLLENLPNPIAWDARGGSQYACQFRVKTFGDIGLREYRFESPPGSEVFFHAERSRSHIARYRSHGFHLVIWCEGENRLDANGQTYAARPGDFSVTRTDTLFSVQTPGRGHAYTLALPTSWDRIGDIRLENLSGNLCLGTLPRCNELLNHVRQLLDQPGALALPDTAETLRAIVALTLNPRAQSEHASGLLALIRGHIDAHCVNPDLGPAEVAAAFDISERHLRRLFAATGTSFTDYLIEQRLARARRMLADPRHRHQSILNIAFDCGFRDVNHFGRRFRAYNGITPSEFRQAPSSIA